MRRESETGARLPGEGVDLDTALAMVTRTAAFSAFAEDGIAMIRAGARADLVLLDREPDALDPPASVWWTMIGGEVCFRANRAPVFPE